MGHLLLLGVAALIIVYVPAFTILCGLGVDRRISVLLSPVWTAGMMTVSSLLFVKLEIAWTLTNYLMFSGVVAVMVHGLGILIAERTKSCPREHRSLRFWFVTGETTKSLSWLFLLILSSALMWLPTVWGVEPWVPPQHNDSTFHLSAVMSIVQTGQASPTVAFSSLYGFGQVDVAYPAVWHQITSLLATESTVVQASKGMYLTISVIWLVNISILAEDLLFEFPNTARYALVVAQVLPVFPVYYLTHLPLWPNALGIAMIPGLLAALHGSFRNANIPKAPSRNKIQVLMNLDHVDITALSVSILCVFGLIAAYPPAAFSLGVLLLGALLRVVLGALRISESPTQKVGIIVFGLGTIFVPVLTVTWSEKINWLFGRPVEIFWDNISYKLWATFTLSPAGGGSITYKLMLAGMGILVPLGVYLSLKNRVRRWLIVSYFAVLMLVLGTLFPLGPLTRMTGIWYYGSYRLMPVLAIPSVIFITYAFLIGTKYLSERYKLSKHETLNSFSKRFFSRKTQSGVVSSVLILALILLLVGGASWSSRYEKTRELYNPVRFEPVFMADKEELNMILRVGENLTDGKLLLGEASTGAALVYITTGAPVVYKQIAYGSVATVNDDSLFIAKNFRDYKSNPRVCQLVKKYNVGYFYADRNAIFNEKEQKERAEGLFGVVLDPADFKLIDAGGTAEVYRFTGCDSMQFE